MDIERRRIKQAARIIAVYQEKSIMVYDSQDASKARIDAGIQRMLNGRLKPTAVEVFRLQSHGRTILKWHAIWDHALTDYRPAFPARLESMVLERRWVRDLPSKS